MKTLKIIICALLLVFCENSFSQKMDHPPLGMLVDAGGHLLHLNVKGSDGNGPTVVLENGSYDFSFIWSLVQPDVSKFAQVVSYDRAGYAWSESGPQPRSGKQIAYELHTALQNAKIKPPYVLVGQSFGGFLVRSYARFYPSEVVGMVLVDALNEDSKVNMGGRMGRIRESASGREVPPVKNVLNKNEIDRTDSAVQNNTIEPPMDRLPKDIQQLQIWAQSQKRFMNAAQGEMNWSPEDVANMYLNRKQKEYKLGDMPLIVICRGDGGYRNFPDAKQLENERLQLQKELAQLSTKGKLIIDKNSGHNVHLEDPKIVVDAIREVVNAVRNKR